MNDSDEPERTLLIRRPTTLEAPPISDVVGHYLVVLEGARPGTRVELGPEPVTIGRGAQQTIVCNDPDVSRLHLRVALVNGDVIAEDMQSTNGTFVDGARITDAVKLKESSVLRLGGQAFKYERRSRSDVKRSEELDRDIR